MSHVLSIDQGTSGTKAVVVDEAGAVVSSAEVVIRPSYLPGGGVEQDPQELLDSVLRAGRQAVDEADVPIAAVALANQGETVLAWDRATGRPLGNAIVWQDRRAEYVCEARSASADHVRTVTGLELDAYFSAPKMRWVRDHVTADGVVTTSDTWLVHQLTGAFVTDLSTASRSLLVNLESRGWDEDLVSLFGLDGEELPEIVGCDEVVGTTGAFGDDVPVAGLIVDQQAALLAESCFETGTGKCTYGTGAFLLAQAGPRPTLSTRRLTTSVAWLARGEASFCLDGQVYTAASAVRWMIELGLIGAASDLDKVAERSSDGVLCVPALAGLGAPFWDSQATASLVGMSLSSARGHVVKAVLDGIAAQVATLLDLMAEDLQQPFTRLRVDGGLTRSAALMQAQADLAQMPLDVYPSPHATPLGAAACARLALDPSLSLQDAVGEWEPSATYEPQWSADQAGDHLSRWHQAATTSLPKEAG